MTFDCYRKNLALAIPHNYFAAYSIHRLNDGKSLPYKKRSEEKGKEVRLDT